MGFLSRLHKIVTGIGGAVEAPFGLAKDLVTAPWRDDADFDGLVHTLYGRTVARGGQVLGNLLGPTEGLGALFGGLPEGVRQPARSVVNPALHGLETAYREGIAEPVSAAITASSLADRPGGGGVIGLFRGENWKEGYRIAQHRSPGQALAYAALTRDITNDVETARAAGSDAFDVISGVTDAVLRMTLDPSVLVGHAAGAARTAYWVRPIATLDDIDAIADSRRFATFVDNLEGRDAASIRHDLFPHHEAGAVISTVLADATSREERISALRAMMGDRAELDVLHQQKAALAGRISRAVDSHDLYGALDDAGFVLPPSAGTRSTRLEQLKAELDDLYPEADRLARREAAFATIRESPRSRYPISGSDWYQTSALAAPLRVVFDMTPHRFVDLERADGDVQVSRMLRNAGVDPEVHDALRARYMAAVNPGERQTALIAAETAAVRHIAEQAGMTTGDIEKVLAQAGKDRNTAASMLRSRVYDGEGRSRLTFVEDGTSVTHELPLTVTQEANVLPVVDIDEVKRAATPIGQFRLRHPGTDVPSELLNSFYRLWKPSVLLRVGWPMRVIGDEQLRIVAKVGALSQLKALRTGVGNLIEDVRAGVPRAERVPGVRGWIINGYDIEGAFGVPSDSANIYRHLASSRASFDRFFGKEEQGVLGRLRSGTGEWRSLTPTDDGYGQAWEHALNMQLGKDRMARQFLAGRTVDEVADWLRATPEGIAYGRRLPYRAVNPRGWAGTVAEQVASYTRGSPELADLALRGKATAADLERLLPDAASRPIVHGEVLAQALGNSVVGQALSGIVEKGFRALGSAPSDVLSRQPFFDAMYQAEVGRLVDLIDTQGVPLSEDLIHQAERKAREYALGQTKDLLYDLAESSRLAEMLRFFMPFYSAWQEVITRWAGLAVENPAFIARGRLVWSAPDKAGLVTTDQNGNEYITVRVPDWVSDLPGMRGLRTQGAVRFSKQAFNLALQGTPGFGPVVQIPTNEIVKDRPDLEAATRFILPFGTTQDTTDLLLPATAKRAFSRAEGEENRSYRNAMLRIYFDKVTDYQLGRRKTRPTYDEAHREADAFFNLRTVANFVSPASPSFTSPYQPYIDAYRNLRDADPEHADERFLDEYGPEYFALTQTLTRSKDGVPPTIEGWKARQKYRDLIEAAPELGGLIVGAEGAGAFSKAVYDAQLADRLRPGSALHQREPMSFEEAAAAPNMRLGWIEYGKAMDLIDAERIQRGLPNLQVKAARDLAEIKAAITAKLSERYPEWADDRAQTDENKFKKRIAAMKVIATDPRLAQRPDIAGLGEYLHARDLLTAELASRAKAGGAKTLTARTNQDLAGVWGAITAALTERNVAFAALYHRWLEFDPLEAA